MEIGMNAVMATNELYNNSLTQFMNIQIAVNEGKLTKQQATTMLRNIANMTKTGFKSINEMGLADVQWKSVASNYESELKELFHQMQDYLQNELNPTKTL